MEKKYKVGQEVEVLTQKDPDVWRKAFISSIATCLGYKVTLVTYRETDVQAHAVTRNIRPVDVSMGALTHIFDIVDGCNGLYVYYLPTNECKGAGDGSEVTVGDLAAFARFEPAGFAEAYGPADFSLSDWEACEICGQWQCANSGLCKTSVGQGAVAKRICEECHDNLVKVTTPKGRTRYFPQGEEDAASYFYHFGDGYAGVEYMRSMGVLPPTSERGGKRG